MNFLANPVVLLKSLEKLEIGHAHTELSHWRHESRDSLVGAITLGLVTVQFSGQALISFMSVFIYDPIISSPSLFQTVRLGEWEGEEHKISAENFLIRLVDRSQICIIHNRILYKQKSPIMYICAYIIKMFMICWGEIWSTKNINNILILQNISLDRNYREGENVILIVYIWNYVLNFTLLFGVCCIYIGILICIIIIIRANSKTIFIWNDSGESMKLE